MKRPHSQSPLPSKDDLVAFIGQQPGKVGTREIARAFDLRNADRAALKTMHQTRTATETGESQSGLFCQAKTTS